MSEPRKFNSSRGFTIMEVALAATVLALTLVGMIQVVESGTEMLDVSRKQTIAAQILHSEIDQLRLQNWANLVALPAPTTNLPFGPSIDSLPIPMFSNAVQILTETLKKSSTGQSYVYMSVLQPNLLQVTFTVTWIGITGHTYTRSSTTYVSQNGLNVTYQRP